MGADSVLEELLNSWKAFWIYLSRPVKARTATVHLGLEDNFHGVKYSFNSFLPETTSWCCNETAKSTVCRPPLQAKEWPGMTLKLHLWSSEQKPSQGEKAVPGLVSPSRAEAAEGDSSRIAKALEQLIKMRFSFNFLDIKHRRGFGGEEPEVFRTNASLFECLS